MADQIRKILIIDDANTSHVPSMLLKRKGFEVVLASSGEAGLEVIRKTADISLILLDIYMPDRDGITILQDIRKLHSMIELPVIILTAKGSYNVAFQAMHLGANDYLIKPFDIKNGISIIEHELAKSARLKTLSKN